ncbi:hypothetical protein SLEP1_g17772 [Rubroshorea leprosula]|uniref:RING-type domain-containing protein n=1 Tax=Rubroshorea leprosula TaxID=152421 RepID=A0AAV5J4F2_9ROSI|nr:hypothetical protein SLEP1_g17772 [Rubroshorea leprosula]
MENATAVIGSPPPPPQPLPPPFFPSVPPPSPLGNAINDTVSPPSPQLRPFFDTSFLMPPPAFPDDSRSVDLSPLEFILALMAVVTIPALIYAFFFAVKCPSWTSRRADQQSSDEFSTDNSGGGGAGAGADRVPEPVSGVKYQKESHLKEIGIECPVCLSVFVDGEEVRQLSACKHAFHATCINLWLSNHPNCPVCRATVAVTKPNDTPAAPQHRRRNEDMQQGLPDAANLV